MSHYTIFFIPCHHFHRQYMNWPEQQVAQEHNAKALILSESEDPPFQSGGGDNFDRFGHETAGIEGNNYL